MMKQKHPQRLVEKKKELCESKVHTAQVFSAMISFRLFKREHSSASASCTSAGKKKNKHNKKKKKKMT